MLAPVAAMKDVKLASYEPLIELAAGGMATVYIARHLAAAGFERLVVIKRVHPHLLRNREFCDMFRDEAHVCAAIRSANVVPVIDVVEADGELFLVLEYVESLSLSDLLAAAKRAHFPLPPSVVARIFVDALAGLHAAHEAKDLRGARLDAIHRDVSPQNVIVGVDGSSRLIDFGIAKAASRISVTNSGVVKGKLRYMSPEQVRQKPLDRRADIFAAGVVLFEALTGRRAFAGEDEGDIALAILLGELPAPSSLVPELSLALDAVVTRALARDREERFETAAEFQEALERALPAAPSRDVARVVAALAGSTFAARHAALEAAMTRVPPSTRSEAPQRGAPPRPRKRGRGLAVAATVLFAGLGSAALFARHPATTAPAASTTTSTAAVASASAPLASAPVTASVTSPPPATPPRRPASPTRPELRRGNPYGHP